MGRGFSVIMKIGIFETNNIYNVDCYEAIKNIPDNSIDCIYTDIPYLLNTDGGGGSFHNVIQNKKKEIENISNGIDYKIIDEFIRVMKNINCFIWCSQKQIYDIMTCFKKTKCSCYILTWAKTNPTPLGSMIWLNDIEYCLHFYKDAGYNVGSKYKHKNYVEPINVIDKKYYSHPTIKPLEMVKNHLLNLTKESDIVLDCFLGSGTTAVACKELNRQYIGFEIDKQYFDIAKDRLDGLTIIDRKRKEKGQVSIFDLM